MLNMSVQMSNNLEGLHGICLGKYLFLFLPFFSQKNKPGAKSRTQSVQAHCTISLNSPFLPSSCLPLASPALLPPPGHFLHYYETWSRSLDSLWESSSWWQHKTGETVTPRSRQDQILVFGGSTTFSSRNESTSKPQTSVFYYKICQIGSLSSSPCMVERWRHIGRQAY